eukprot:superscaffoldBa00001442_g10578
MQFWGDTKQGVKHHISTTGPPVHAWAWRLDPAKLTIPKTEFEIMERFSIIRHSDCPWASPPQIMPKPCGDYHQLNNATTPDRYSVLHIQNFSACLAGSIIFSKVDLIRGYHQVPVHPLDVPNMAVITSFGLLTSSLPAPSGRSMY